MRRGDIWWATAPREAAGGERRPVVIVSADSFNRSKIATLVVALVSSDRRLAAAPGNFPIAPPASGLDRDAVVDVSQLATLPRAALRQHAGRLTAAQLVQLDEGLQLALAV